MARTRTLLEDVEDFLLLHPEVTPARLGRDAVGDKDVIFDMRRGRSPREVTVNKMRAWMVSYTTKREAERAAVRKRLDRSLAPAAGA
jgi:hypothetical protein